MINGLGDLSRIGAAFRRGGSTVDRLRTLLLVIGIVAVAVVVAGYLFLMLDQANADLLETTASLQETTADLQETTIELEIRKALNINLESENSALLSQKEGLESARSALEVSLGDALSESAGLQVDLRVANAQAQEQEARYERLSSERDDLAAQHEDLGFSYWTCRSSTRSSAYSVTTWPIGMRTWVSGTRTCRPSTRSSAYSATSWPPSLRT